MKMAHVFNLGLHGPRRHCRRDRLVDQLGCGGLQPAGTVADQKPQRRLARLSGTVKPIGGAEERISCRVNYAGATAHVSQKISCAGTDYKFEASAEVNCSGDAVSGNWTEKVANNTGGVNGTISGDKLNIEVDRPNFKGRFAIKVTGSSKQSLTITQFDPGAGRYVAVATIALSR